MSYTQKNFERRQRINRALSTIQFSDYAFQLEVAKEWAEQVIAQIQVNMAIEFFGDDDDDDHAAA
jgi:hypothetical protein